MFGVEKMIINQNSHLFIKFHEEGQGEFSRIKTMEEHINVLEDKGRVIWGHFTSRSNKKGLWDQKMKPIERQVSDNIPTFVFFCDKSNNLLYMGVYLNSYKRADIEADSPQINYIPEYYHHKVGEPEVFIESELRSYAYIEFNMLFKLDFNESNYIFFTDKQGVTDNVLNNKGSSSIFYVNLEEDFYERCIDTINNSVVVEDLSYEKLDEEKLSDNNQMELNPIMDRIKFKEPIPKTEKVVNNTEIKFEGHKTDYEKKHKYNTKIGKAGEEFIFEYEKQKLIDAGRFDLLDQVEWTSQEVGDGTGYDIKSVTITGEPMYIEVKTTTSKQNRLFKVTFKEMEFSKMYSDNFYLYRVFNFDPKKKTGKVSIDKGDIRANFNFEPSEFKVYK